MKVHSLRWLFLFLKQMWPLWFTKELWAPKGRPWWVLTSPFNSDLQLLQACEAELPLKSLALSSA